MSPSCVNLDFHPHPLRFLVSSGKIKPEAPGHAHYCASQIQQVGKEVSVAVSLGCGRDLLWVSVVGFYLGL